MDFRDFYRTADGSKIDHETVDSLLKMWCHDFLLWHIVEKLGNQTDGMPVLKKLPEDFGTANCTSYRALAMATLES